MASRPDLADRRRLLDIGGGTGSWSIAAVRAPPDLSATVVDLPVTTDIARKRIAGSDVADRMDVVVAADAHTDPLPAAHDAFLMANVIHDRLQERNTALLHRIRAVAGTGARLYLADFWTDPMHTEPLMAALMAGEFAVHLAEGDVTASTKYASG